MIQHVKAHPFGATIVAIVTAAPLIFAALALAKRNTDETNLITTADTQSPKPRGC